MRPKLEVDWRNNGQWLDISDLIESSTVTREYAGTLPDEVTLVEGFSAARFNVRLKGLMRALQSVPQQFTTGVEGWTGIGVNPPEFTNSTLDSYGGTHSLRIAWNTGGVLDGVLARDFTGLPIGVPITFKGRVKIPTGSQPVLFVSPGNGLGFSSNSFDQWQDITLSFITTSPTHALQIWPASGPTLGQIAYIDEIEYYTEPEHISSALSPYNAAGPNYEGGSENARIRYSIVEATDTGPVTVQQLTGRVRELALDFEDQSADLVALDLSEDLRASITLPIQGIGESMFLDPTQVPPWRTNTHWVVDYVFRRNSIYQSHPPLAEAEVSATLHGGLAPEVGFGGWPSGKVYSFQGDAWVAGNWGLALYGGPEIDLGITYRTKTPMSLAPSTDQWGFGVWIKFSNVNVFRDGSSETTLAYLMRSADSGLRLRLTTAGQLKLQVLSAGSVIATHNCPAIAPGSTPAWHFIGFQAIPTAPGTTVNWRFNATIPSSTSVSHSAIAGAPWEQATLALQAIAPMQLAQVFRRSSGSGLPAWWNGAWTSLPVCTANDPIDALACMLNNCARNKGSSGCTGCASNSSGT